MFYEYEMRDPLIVRDLEHTARVEEHHILPTMSDNFLKLLKFSEMLFKLST